MRRMPNRPLDCSLDTGECNSMAPAGPVARVEWAASGGDPLVRVETGLDPSLRVRRGQWLYSRPTWSGVEPTLDIVDHCSIQATSPGPPTTSRSTRVDHPFIGPRAAATKVFSAVEPKNEITVEAWVEAGKPRSGRHASSPPRSSACRTSSLSAKLPAPSQDAETGTPSGSVCSRRVLSL